MKILSIIPSRGGSKGIPLKNLALLNNKPLQYYTINASLNSKLITRTIVSTDNKKIAEHAKLMGAEVFSRPKKLSIDSAHIEPIISDILKRLKNNENFIPDIIVLLQNTSPLRNSFHIDECLKKLITKKFDSILSGSESKALVWQIKNNNEITPITYDPYMRENRQIMAKNKLLENGAIYATKYKNFIRSKSRVSGKIGFYKMPSDMYYEIDQPSDLLIVDHLMKTFENYTDPFSVKNKNIILTGSSGLLGSHYAKVLLERGANLALVDHSAELSQKIVSKFNHHNQKVKFYRCDLSKPKQILQTFKKIIKDFKTIDVLINNAAFVSAKSFTIKNFKNYETHPLDLWKKSFEVNVDAVHICCQETLKIMKKQKYGSIINISSNYGLVSPSFETYENEPLWTPPEYAVTKSAILNLTRYIAHLYGKYNIRCNNFILSGVATKRLSNRFKKRYGSKTAFDRMATVDDYTGPIVFLSSDGSSYMTGANLVVDGGWTSK